MDINKLSRLMSDKNKSKIITHFYSCKCKNFGVQGLCKKFEMEQSLMSKHLATLKEIDCLHYVTDKKNHKNRYYYMPDHFKKEWSSILEPMINHKDLKEYKCKC